MASTPAFVPERLPDHTAAFTPTGKCSKAHPVGVACPHGVFKTCCSRFAAQSPKPPAPKPHAKELVIVTGISGAGKASAIKAFEDLGFHAVDNLPLELLPDFARLVRKSTEVERAAIVVDIREGATLDRLPEILKTVKKLLPTRVVFLDAQDAVLVQRYSETRRPHPLGRLDTVSRSIVEERSSKRAVASAFDARRS